MPVPSNGTISLGSIGKELRSSGTGDDYDNGPDTSNATSLKDASDGSIDTINTENDSADRPDGSAPHAMSEFYSYDHNAASAPPSAPSLSYSATSTTTITWIIDEPATATSVSLHLGSGAYDGAQLTVNGSTTTSCDGSGDTSLLVGDGNDSVLGATINYSANNTVTYKARATNGGGNSSFSSAVSGYTLPNAPSAGFSSTPGINSATISWSAPTGGASSYKVYRSTTNPPTSLYTTTSNTSLTLTGMSSSTTYYWRIKSVGTGGDISAYSATQNFTTSAPGGGKGKGP